MSQILPFDVTANGDTHTFEPIANASGVVTWASNLNDDQQSIKARSTVAASARQNGRNLKHKVTIRVPRLESTPAGTFESADAMHFVITGTVPYSWSELDVVNAQAVLKTIVAEDNPIGKSIATNTGYYG